MINRHRFAESPTVMVVPCFNEARRLDARAFLDFARRWPAIQLLMVDDGSTDDTPQRLHDMARRSAGRIAVLQLTANTGKAEAVRRGVLAALESNPELVGYWDADLATPLDQIPRFCQVLVDRPEVQLVLGVRIRLLGHRIRRSAWRGRLGRLFAQLASRTLGIRMFDTQCGAKLFRVTPAIIRAFRHPFLARWIFDVELISRLVRLAAPSRPHEILFEYPLERWQEVGGSRLKPGDFVRAPLDLMAICWAHWRHASVAPHESTVAADKELRPAAAGVYVPRQPTDQAATAAEALPKWERTSWPDATDAIVPKACDSSFAVSSGSQS
ncbi:MAG: glycosyltransferase [Planctomycetota bacterium]